MGYNFFTRIGGAYPSNLRTRTASSYSSRFPSIGRKEGGMSSGSWKQETAGVQDNLRSALPRKDMGLAGEHAVGELMLYKEDLGQQAGSSSKTQIKQVPSCVGPSASHGQPPPARFNNEGD
ncbi:unnamed protein product [Nesidiocoris tenuis]|uniref:Uncharacterized protein n=1 Tax=Nesidiocoris tenuis TaxID=355587 RepID=A0A6H5HSD7_9HEMI|nr:unnamed protein product [Nesidiocoris tenuis]